MNQDNGNFCCEGLKGLYDIANEFRPNFRIIYNSEDFINKGIRRGVKIKREYRFIITQGYSNAISSETNRLFINYCPFCGIDLMKKYGHAQFINETNHLW